MNLKKNKQITSNFQRFTSFILIIILIILLYFFYSFFISSSFTSFTFFSSSSSSSSSLSCKEINTEFISFSNILNKSSFYLESSSKCLKKKFLLYKNKETKCQNGNDLKAGDCIKESNGKIRCLPSFIIAGAMKSGTGALLRWLGMHPSITAGKGDGGTNEVHFFDPKISSLPCVWESYVSHFPKMTMKQAKTMITFDKSPDYMRSYTKMNQISSLLPNVRILVILRNPTSRAYSGFHHNCRHERFSRVINSFTHQGVFYPVGSVIRTDEEYNLNEGRSSSDGNFNEKNNLKDVPKSHLQPIEKGKCTYEDFHRYIFLSDPYNISSLSSTPQFSPSSMVDLAIGHYDVFLQNIYSLFPQNQVLVLFQEHMNSNTLSTLRRVESFLELPENDYKMDSWLTTRNGDHGFYYVWKDYWKPSYTSQSASSIPNSGNTKKGNVDSNSVTITSSGMLSTTKTLIDNYYANHNFKLKEILMKYNGIPQDLSFPSTWPLK